MLSDNLSALEDEYHPGVWSQIYTATFVVLVLLFVDVQSMYFTPELRTIVSMLGFCHSLVKPLL